MAADIPQIAGPGNFDIEVVGESNYQAQLIKICGSPSRDGVNQEVRAFLLLENDNKFDRKAVMVVIGGGKVGYLPRDLAREFRAAIIAGGLREYSMFECAALIRGGWDRGRNDNGSYGVWLDLPDDESD